MVKHKAGVSLDEWLEQGAILVETSTTKKADVPVEQPGTSNFAITSLDSGSHAEQPAAAELVAGPLLAEGNQSQVTESEAHAWFWSLLEQAGYELVWLVRRVSTNWLTGVSGYRA